MEKLNETIIDKLIRMVTMGLVRGKGYEVDEFCVQQAVSKVIMENKFNDSDHPDLCVGYDLIQLGIMLNDMDWSSNKARGKGLKRFAVAELGSNKLDLAEFRNKYAQKAGLFTGMNLVQSTASIIMQQTGGTMDEKITAAANLAVQVLQEMGSEGSKFLYLLDEPDKKKAKTEARKLGMKIFASQMAEINYCCSGTCNAQH